ncbi:DNA-directed RNA polymerase subunit alpha [Candidatus Saccharibacteria bacterium]|nr:DNA-directed RNA polymerase subunit alpha [Candidatus Saccharibacteria bacterium]
MSTMIHNPTLAQVDEHSSTSATFAIEPLHTGYGMTLGNSLRRVLLSSIEGAAVVGFKIEGASHEFTTIEGVKEDVVDIMLNLKQVRFKVYSDGQQTVRIEKKTAGPITAADIKTTDQVDVINTQQLIATLDSAQPFIMDIVVEAGRGYRTIEATPTEHRLSDMIAVDAVFSPVQRVRYKVESTRVGQMTDLDKLLLTIDTDGSLTPKEAFEEAAAILTNQYQALAGSTTVEAAQPLTQPEVSDGAAELMTPIEDLSLTARTANALLNNGIKTIGDLVTLGEVELRELKGFGSKALDEVKDKMAELEF